MIFNIHTDTLYSKTSSNSSLELSSDPVTKAKILLISTNKEIAFPHFFAEFLELKKLSEILLIITYFEC